MGRRKAMRGVVLEAGRDRYKQRARPVPPSGRPVRGKPTSGEGYTLAEFMPVAEFCEENVPRRLENPELAQRDEKPGGRLASPARARHARRPNR